MNIGLDVMGGDYAPDAVIAGAVLAQKHLSNSERITLFGDENAILRLLKNENANVSDFDIVHCSEVIAMGDNPAKTFSKKNRFEHT